MLHAKYTDRSFIRWLSWAIARESNYHHFVISSVAPATIGARAGRLLASRIHQCGQSGASPIKSRRWQILTLCHYKKRGGVSMRLFSMMQLPKLLWGRTIGIVTQFIFMWIQILRICPGEYADAFGGCAEKFEGGKLLNRMDCSVVGVKELILPRKPAAVKYELDRHLICSKLKQ